MPDWWCKANVQLLTQALVVLMKEQKSMTRVCIGYDRRFLSDKAARWMAGIGATE